MYNPLFSHASKDRGTLGLIFPRVQRDFPDDHYNRIIVEQSGSRRFHYYSIIMTDGRTLDLLRDRPQNPRENTGVL
jgi:hypothetical protein